MKVFLILIMLVSGDNEPVAAEIEVENIQICFQKAWAVVQSPLPDVAYLEITCHVEAGSPA